MKKIIFVLMLFISLAMFSQEWQTNFEKAKEIAIEKNQVIVLVFSGSDWCAPCMKLDNEILQSTAFLSFAKKNAVLIKADFPRRKKNKLSKEQQKHNEALAEKYNNHGLFPLIVVLDNKGTVLGETSYSKTSPEEYIALLKTYIKG